MTKALRSDELPLLTAAEQVLSQDDTQTDYVNVPEWGYRLKVRGLMGDERDRYETSFVTFNGNQRVMNMTNARARLVALGTIDEDGKRVFTTAQAEALGKKSAAALERVFSRIQELSGMTDDDLKKMVTVLGNGQTGEDGSA
jgi:hypothetical protein